MPATALSKKIICLIAEKIDSIRDLNALIQVCRRTYRLLNACLYKYDAIYADNTAFFWGVSNSRPGTVRLALSAGADPSRMLQDEVGFYYWGPALREVIARNLGSNGRNPARGRQGRIPDNEQALIRLLFERGGKLDPGMAEFILQDVLFNDDDISLLQLLLEGGIYDELKGYRSLQKTLLRDIAKNEKKLDLLLDHGFPIDCADETGMTLLHHAIVHANVDKVTNLLQRGANPNAQTKAGNTPLHLLLKNNNPTIPDVDEASMLARLVNAGANIGIQATDSRTPLMEFVLQRSRINPLLTITQLHQELGADIYADHILDGGLLHTAAEKNRPDLVKELLGLGLDPNRRDLRGYTALHRAAASQQDLSRDVIDLLLIHGTDVAIPDTLGQIAAQLEPIQQAILRLEVDEVVRVPSSPRKRRLSADNTEVDEPEKKQKLIPILPHY